MLYYRIQALQLETSVLQWKPVQELLFLRLYFWEEELERPLPSASVFSRWLKCLDWAGLKPWAFSGSPMCVQVPKHLGHHLGLPRYTEWDWKWNSVWPTAMHMGDLNETWGSWHQPDSVLAEHSEDRRFLFLPLSLHNSNFQRKTCMLRRRRKEEKKKKQPSWNDFEFQQNLQRDINQSKPACKQCLLFSVSGSSFFWTSYPNDNPDF